MFGRQILYGNKKHFDITDIVIKRPFCNKICLNDHTIPICVAGHSSVIQALAKKSIYVVDVHESAVTESLLQQDKPIKLVSTV